MALTGRLASTFAKLPPPKPEAAKHSFFSLHTLEDVGSAIEQGAQKIYGASGKPGNGKGTIAPGAAIASPIPSTKIAEGLVTAAKNTPKSAVQTITGIGPGLVAAGKAVVHGVEGHPKELEAIGKNLGTMLAHPWSSFQKEPVPMALMAAGGEGTVGRLSGAATRSGAFGEKAAAAASMDRAPLVIYGTKTGGSADQINAGLHDVSIPRTYSPDLIRKGLQVLGEKFRENVRKQNPNMATATEANRYLYGGSLIGQHLFKRAQGFFKPGLVDEQASKGEMIRRLYTKAAAHTMHELKPAVGAEAVPLAVEGIIRRPETVVPDLEKEFARLQDKAQGLTGKELKLNVRNQKQIQGLLADKKFLAKPEEAFRAANDYTSTMSPIEQRMVTLGHLEPDQLHAKLVPYALAHMKAAYNENPGKHPLVPIANSARRAVNTAEKALARAIGEREGRRLPSTIKPITGYHRAVVKAKTRLADARGARDATARNLTDLKNAGAIKPNGDMYPRLELNGKPLTAGEIHAHMTGPNGIGDREVGFLTHKMEQTYGKDLHSYTGTRPGTERVSRTGVSFGNGVYDRSFNALARQAYRNANAVAGHENLDQMLRRFGIGRFHTSEQAKVVADNFAHTPEGEAIIKGLGPVDVHRIGPDRVVDRGNVETKAYGPILHQLGLAEHKSIEEAADTPKYTLLPATVAKRIGEHDKLNQSSQGLRALQWFTNKWRSAALFTSPRWVMGNPQEHAIRLAMANVNPAGIFGLSHSVGIGKDLLGYWHGVANDLGRSESDRYVARAHAAAYGAGTHYGSIAMNMIRRTGKDLVEPGMARDLAEAFSETTPISKMSSLWQKWKGAIGQGMAKVEQNSKAAAIGKQALLEQQKFGSQWRALVGRQDHAVKAFAEGKLSPNEASKFGNDVLDMMGNWNQLTPTVRRAVQTYSPFGLWWLTSMKFVFRVLPRDHPMKVAALAAMEAGTGAANQSKEPSYLQGGIGVHLPIVGDVTLTPEYYSPFGVANEPEKTATGQIFPQAAEPFETLRGSNSLTGKEIAGLNKKPVPGGVRAIRALEGILEGTVPGARQAIQLAQQGGKPDEGSINPIAVKPGSQRGMAQTLVKLFSPVRYTAGERAKQKAKIPGIEVPTINVPTVNVPTIELPTVR